MRSKYCICPKCVLKLKSFTIAIFNVIVFPIEFIDLICWRLSFNLSSDRRNILRIIFLLNVSYSFSKFPVCLPIKLISSNKHRSCFFSGIQQNKVSRYSFIMMNFYQRANSQVLTIRRFPYSLLRIEHRVLFQIYLLIPLKPRYIIKRLLHHRNRQHKRQRRNKREQEPNSQRLNKLTQRNQQKEKVKEKLKLVVQHKRNKRDDVVLLIIQLVRRVTRRASVPIQPEDSILIDRPRGTASSLGLSFLSGV